MVFHLESQNPSTILSAGSLNSHFPYEVTEAQREEVPKITELESGTAET